MYYLVTVSDLVLFAKDSAEASDVFSQLWCWQGKASQVQDALDDHGGGDDHDGGGDDDHDGGGDAFCDEDADGEDDIIGW